MQLNVLLTDIRVLCKVWLTSVNLRVVNLVHSETTRKWHVTEFLRVLCTFWNIMSISDSLKQRLEKYWPKTKTLSVIAVPQYSLLIGSERYDKYQKMTHTRQIFPIRNNAMITGYSLLIVSWRLCEYQTNDEDQGKIFPSKCVECQIWWVSKQSRTKVWLYAGLSQSCFHCSVWF